MPTPLSLQQYIDLHRRFQMSGFNTNTSLGIYVMALQQFSEGESMQKPPFPEINRANFRSLLPLASALGDIEAIKKIYASEWGEVALKEGFTSALTKVENNPLYNALQYNQKEAVLVILDLCQRNKINIAEMFPYSIYNSLPSDPSTPVEKFFSEIIQHGNAEIIAFLPKEFFENKEYQMLMMLNKACSEIEHSLSAENLENIKNLLQRCDPVNITKLFYERNLNNIFLEESVFAPILLSHLIVKNPELLKQSPQMFCNYLLPVSEKKYYDLIESTDIMDENKTSWRLKLKEKNEDEDSDSDSDSDDELDIDLGALIKNAREMAEEEIAKGKQSSTDMNMDDLTESMGKKECWRKVRKL